MKFANQVVWITGASSGIGEALAHTFAREGATLVLSSRRAAELERVRAALPRATEHLVRPLDLAHSENFPALAAEVVKKIGRVDVLVNNGGVGQRALALATTAAVERRIMEVDFFGPVALTKAVLPAMLARGAGQIVIVSSVMGHVGTPGRSSYAAAKHAVEGYFASLRAELWRTGVGVTIASPGYVRTRVSANALGADGTAHGRTDETHQRGISAERCARVIVRGVARGREEIYIGGTELAAIYLQRLSPWLWSRLVRRMKFVTGQQP